VRIDKSSPLPLYYQLAEWLKEQVQTGALAPGEQLPSERELSEQAGISRMTARQAVAYLVRQGVLEVKPGVGTFVVEPKLMHNPLHLLGFSDEIIRQGGAPSSHVLEQVLATPPAEVAQGLQLTPDAPVVKIARLRLSQGIPLLLETVFLPAALCPGLEAVDLRDQSLYRLLEERYDLYPTRTQQTLEATQTNEYQARLFNIKPGVAMILLEGVTYRESNQPIEYFQALYRGDRFKFALESLQDRLGAGNTSTPRIDIVLNRRKD
jgi:GntR family transcriptional regulator